MCKIYDKNNGERIVTIVQMIANRLFPLRFVKHRRGLAFDGFEGKGKLWHLIFGN